MCYNTRRWAVPRHTPHRSNSIQTISITMLEAPLQGVFPREISGISMPRCTSIGWLRRWKSPTTLSLWMWKQRVLVPKTHAHGRQLVQKMLTLNKRFGNPPLPWLPHRRRCLRWQLRRGLRLVNQDYLTGSEVLWQTRS